MLFAALFTIVNVVCHIQSQPMNSNPLPVDNLMPTFDMSEEIPPISDIGGEYKAKVYKACQDGSGGICVEVGMCPAELRPQTRNPEACPSDMECCFGAAKNDNSCGSRGGECTSRQACGNAPIFALATDCKNGEVCCIRL